MPQHQGPYHIHPRHSGARKARTTMRNCASENLEIPRCAIAHLRCGPSDHPGMTESLIASLALAIVNVAKLRKAKSLPSSSDRMSYFVQIAFILQMSSLDSHQQAQL